MTLFTMSGLSPTPVFEQVMLRLASSIESLQDPIIVVEISFIVLSYLSDCLMDLQLGDLDVDTSPPLLWTLLEISPCKFLASSGNLCDLTTPVLTTMVKGLKD